MACRALGFPGVKTTFTSGSSFGDFVATDGKSAYAFENMQCLGAENDFNACGNAANSETTFTTCTGPSKSNAAGVECFDLSSGQSCDCDWMGSVIASGSYGCYIVLSLKPIFSSLKKTI